MDRSTKSSAPGAIRQPNKIVLITGSSGLIGTALIKRLSQKFQMIGLDKVGPKYAPLGAECISFDLTDERSIAAALERVRYGYGSQIASVVHLAAFYSFNTENSPKYQEINIEGTKKLLGQLKDFEVDQLIFSSSDLIYKPTEPGVKINEDCPIEANWGYPESKIQTEKLIREGDYDFNCIFLRIAGVYTDYGHSIPITQQIKRIYEKQFISHFYSGEMDHGDVFVHLDDLLDAIEKTIEKRDGLPNELAINIGEPVTPTYKELQDTIGSLVHDEKWETYEMPRPIAKAGAWTRDLVGHPFIKPWMIDRAGEHYELDISRAKQYLDWEPKHRLMETLPKMIENLKEDPEAWYRKNKLD